MINNKIKAYCSISAVKSTGYLNSAEVEAEAE